MAALKFLCPKTGDVVDTEIDLDTISFARLPSEDTCLACPHCEAAAHSSGRIRVVGRMSDT